MQRQLRSVYASFKRRTLFDIQYIVPQSQHCTSDCGVFAIANTFLLLSKIQPQSVYLQQSKLRSHVLQSLTAQYFMPFPSTSKCTEYQLKYKQMQRKDANFRYKENLIRNDTRGTKRKLSDYKADENAKTNATRKTKRLDTSYKADENAKRNATRGIKRLDTNYKADENAKRNATRGTKRLDSNFKADATRYKVDENTKGNVTRAKKQKDYLYKTAENKRRKISKLLSKFKTQGRHPSKGHKIQFMLPIIQQLIHDLCKTGDEYICTSCNQSFYQHNVYLASKESYKKRNIPDPLLTDCLTATISACSSEWICKTCHKYLLQKKI